jgi:hypothetical protein
MGALAQSAIPSTVRGTSRVFTIPSCSLEPSDLRRLYSLLEQKALEAADRQIGAMIQQPGQTQAQFDEWRMVVRSALSLYVRLQTRSGVWVGGTTMDPLKDDQLPDGITRIEFDSAFVFRSRFNNIVPNNAFLLTIDLVRPSILDMGTEPTSNGSIATMSGTDSTWANSLYAELATYFSDRLTKRGWLHLGQSYTALVILLGFPLSFNIVYHLDSVIRRRATLPEALSVAVYVYVVLVVLFLFRITFNYARWVFPKVEVDAPRQHVGGRHRVAISALGLMVIGALVKAALKLLGIG